MITVDGRDGGSDGIPLMDFRRSSSSAALKWRRGTLALAAVQKFGARAGNPCYLPPSPLLPPTRRLRTGTTVIRAVYGFKRGAGVGQNREHLALHITETEPVSVDKLQELVQRKSLPLLQKLGGLPGLASALETDLATGLPNNNQQELEWGHSCYRSDFNPSKPLKPFWWYAWEATQHPILLLLMLYALLSIVFGIMSPGAVQYAYEGGSIAISLLFVISITAVSDYGQSFRFWVLVKNKEEDIQVAVIRGGDKLSVSIFDLVVGDVVLLKTNDIVPGNGLLIEGHSLIVNEASLTGKSNTVRVDGSANPFLLFGCKVTSGTGTMLVTGVGTNIEWGNIMSTVSEDTLSSETPLQARLRDLAAFFGKVGALVAFVGLLVLLVSYFINSSMPFQTAPFKCGVTSAKQIAHTVVKILFVAMTIAILAVPDGLPLAIILTLANSMKKMMADRVLVRRLSTCETMGFITTICTARTATLTVLKCWMGGHMYTESECMNAPIRLQEGIAVVYSCCSVEGGPAEVTGSPMEKAILNWGLKLGIDYKHYHQALSIVCKKPFSSEKKCMGVAIQSPDCATIRVHWTGPADIILGLCSRICTADGQGEVARCMPAKMRNEIHEIIDKMADDGFCCIAFAYRLLQQISEEVRPEETDGCQLPEDGLSLLAIVGMRDSCRPEVSEAIHEWRKAGIVVRMVTGDNLELAVEVAKECGILTSDESLELSRHAIEGARFRDWSKEERASALADIKVMACSSPRINS